MPVVVDPRAHTPDLPAVLAPDRSTGYATELPVAGAGTPAAPAALPPWRRRLPSKDSVDYVRDAITTVILILALPYIVHQLCTRPGKLIEGVGRAKVTG